MRLHRLELEGFGPFRERQVVDFDGFADDGIFLIAGRTGAGKSSVLDGVCFALYGGVPRYDGVEKRLRSDHCAPDEPTSVTVEFSAAGSRWRVTRSPEYDRPKQRGTGLTTEPHRAQLDEWVDGAWIGRAARPVDVARELDEILGLNQQQFLQVILLAQNRFAEFLHAKNDERQRLLRRLFGTRTYEDYQAAFEQRRKDAEHDLASAGEGVSLLLAEAERLIAGTNEAATDALGEDLAPADVPARLEAAALGVQRADYRVETLTNEQNAADTALRTAESALAAAKTLRERQEQRLRSRVALATLDAQAEAIAADRHALERAVAAETLRTPIEAAARAEHEASRTAERAEEARVAWAALADAAPDADAPTLRALVDDLTGGLALWADAAERERGLARLEERIATDRARAAEFADIIAALDSGRAALPARLKDLDAELEPLRSAAAGLAAADTSLAGVVARLAAARDAERLATALATAEVAYLEAGSRHDLARAAVTALLQRRLAGHAGELAAALIDGEPCAVCGAIEHPQPAPASSDPVTDDEISAAEVARDRAAAAEKLAADAARAARESFGAAAARAGGEPVPTLESARTAAAAAVDAARRAATDRDRLTAERAALVQADADAATERQRLTADLAAVKDALATAEAEADLDRRAVTNARGDFGTVRERIADATERRARATALADALAALETAQRHARAAVDDRDERVAASDFADAADATAALKDAGARAALGERVREHEVALRTERDRLRDLELALAGEPEELADVTAAATRHADAREQWTSIGTAVATAIGVAARLRDLVERAAAAHAALGGLADDHAVIARLANTVAGRAPNTHRMTLESFVLAAELEEIVEAANLRLDDMSTGRYRLQHTDALAARGAASGLGLQIMDAHTGQSRPAQSLSGGETFLASLALALGLAEVVTARAGGVRLDTLFIDEGFGSLDDDTLDLAMRTLDELRQGGRTVGLISHVAAMKEQIPAQLLVEATAQGPSVIHQDSAVTATA